MPRLRPDRPNVVVFFTDQQRWDTVGLHGNPLDLTPNLDRMARRGTHVPNAFTPQPVCAPTRACLQTGLYPTTSGIYRNHLPLPASTPTLAHHFGEAGYQTGYIGKWHLADRDPVPPEQRGGYQSWLAANLLEFSSDAYETTLYDERGAGRSGCPATASTPSGTPRSASSTGTRTSRSSSSSPSWSRTTRTTATTTPPRTATPSGTPAAGRRPTWPRWAAARPQHLGGYWGMVKRLDEALGRLLDALKSLGLLDDTIVVFTSDHGCHFKTRNSEYKRSCHDASIRVPLALQGPGFDGGGQIRELVSLIDLPPTLLDAAGLPVPAEMQGRSFLRLARGDRAGWPEEVFVQISEAQVGRAVRTERWKYSVSAPDRDAWNDAGERPLRGGVPVRPGGRSARAEQPGRPGHVLRAGRRAAGAADPADGRGWRGRADDRAGAGAAGRRARPAPGHLPAARRRRPGSRRTCRSGLPRSAASPSPRSQGGTTRAFWERA